MKEFNVTGNCVPDMHYMVDMSGKIAQIVEMVDKRQYFTINRARQYGKTTTLGLLEKKLTTEYLVARMSFEAVGDLGFETEEKFVHMFMEEMSHCLNEDAWLDESITTFKMLSRHITKMCDDKRIVLMIDEVDKTSNNQVFLHFLGLLRSKYLDRNEKRDTTFHSVILAGVHDIKNIKYQMVVKGIATLDANEGSHNSPWNIAADFDVDMSFSPTDIATMLSQYEDDHQTGMDIATVSQEIYNYTSGYPFLVSRICQHIDGKFGKDWTLNGVQAAVKILLTEKNTLFDDMMKNIKNNISLYNLMYDVLIVGKNRTFSDDNTAINLGTTFGLLKENSGATVISNKIFEIRICNFFIVEDEEKGSGKSITGVLRDDVIHDDRFNMELCLAKFAEHYKEVFNPANKKDAAFLERHGRMVFLSYLKPLINGNGFYHIESELTDLRRMDIIVDYGSDQFIIELKLWKGAKKHEEAYSQLIGYLDKKKSDVGYLLTFDFSQKSKNQVPQWVTIDNKRIFDVVV